LRSGFQASARRHIDMVRGVSHSFFRGSKKREPRYRCRETSRREALREELMRKLATAALAAVGLTFALSAPANAADKTICVAWKTFQEERWKTDEAAIKAVVDAAGDKFISADAQTSAQKQAADIEGLITQGCNVILVVAYDSDAILPSIQKINDAGIKAIAYD